MIYILLVILSVHTEAGTINQYRYENFADLQDCQVREGVVLTSANSDPDVLGWIVVDECKPIGIPKKA